MAAEIDEIDFAKGKGKRRAQAPLPISWAHEGTCSYYRHDTKKQKSSSSQQQ